MPRLPILSICIPTYNRSACLRECLESILFSAKGYEEQIEIVVSDNASTDDTSSVINEFRKFYPWIRYHRNDSNIGPERNFYAAAGLGLGEYIWIFGDDDKMSDEAIPIILNRIELGYNLIICNYSSWSSDFSALKQERSFLIYQDEEYNNANLLLKRFGLHVGGYITTCIIKKNIFFSIPPTEYEPYIEYGFPHLYSVCVGIADNCHAIIISIPLVCNRSDNMDVTLHWNKYFITGINLLFEALVAKGYTRNAVNKAKHLQLKYIMYFIIGRKAHNNIDSKSVSRLLFHYYKKDWLFWAVCVPVLYIPIPKLLLRFTIRITKMVLEAARKRHLHPITSS